MAEMNMITNLFDTKVRPFMRRWGMTALRIALGIVYVWFGALKLTEVSPVVGLIHETYTFFPGWFVTALAIGEIVIGLGLIFWVAPRTTVVLLWMQLAGTFGCFVLNPSLFFMHGNPLLLTMWGEFVVKNIVFVAAGLAIGGQESRS
jgi:putative oxidoreductase